MFWIPLDRTSRQSREVGQLADRVATNRHLHRADRLLSRLDAVDKVPVVFGRNRELLVAGLELLFPKRLVAGAETFRIADPALSSVKDHAVVGMPTAKLRRDHGRRRTEIHEPKPRSVGVITGYVPSLQRSENTILRHAAGPLVADRASMIALVAPLG